MVCPVVKGNLISLNSLLASFQSLKFRVVKYSAGLPMASGPCEVKFEVDLTLKIEPYIVRLDVKKCFGGIGPLIRLVLSWISGNLINGNLDR